MAMGKFFNKTILIPAIAGIFSLGAGNVIATNMQQSDPTRVSQEIKKIKANKEQKLEYREELEDKIKESEQELADLDTVKEAVSHERETIDKEKDKLDSAQEKIDKAEQDEKERQEKIAEQKRQAEEARKEQAAKAEKARQEQAKRAQAAPKNNNQGSFNTATDGQGQIIGNSRSKIFHVPGQAAYHIKPENIVRFNSVQEAIAAGYRQSAR